MQFFRRAEGKPERLAILSAAFNPPTRAHTALARAGLKAAGEILFVLPRVFPHSKDYRRVGLFERVRLLEAALHGEPRYSIAATEGGLFIEIARECRAAYDPGVRLMFLCGRDAAERIVSWDYGRPGAIDEMLEEFELLVAPRHGPYVPPAALRHRIHAISLDEECDHVSGSEIRRRIGDNEPWEHLVPENIIPLVRELYTRPWEEI